MAKLKSTLIKMMKCDEVLEKEHRIEKVQNKIKYKEVFVSSIFMIKLKRTSIF